MEVAAAVVTAADSDDNLSLGLSFFSRGKF